MQADWLIRQMVNWLIVSREKGKLKRLAQTSRFFVSINISTTLL
jgi:hypothetical protein